MTDIMRICITSGTFHPDIGGPPTYLHAFARALVDHGHRLRVVTYGGSTHAYSYRVTRVARELPAPVRLALFGLATMRAACSADLLYVNDYGLPPAVANMLLRKPLVMKVVGDFAWEYAVRHSLVPRDLTIDAFQRRRFTPAVERVRALQKWYARRADLVITPSHYLAAIVTGWGVARERLRVIHNAAAPAESDPSISQPGLHPRSDSGPTFLVATIARLAPWKGVDVLIQAAAQARQECPNMRLLVIGDGDDRQTLERLAEPLNGAVRFTGEVNREYALGLLRRSDALALCSSYEGLSHVLLEAMAAGKPVVTSAVGGNLELIRDGANGLFVPYGDAAALAAALVRLAKDPALGARLGRQAQLDSAAYSWPRLVDQTLAVFQEAVASRRKGPR
jgi:glycosyltransferase involved in cell wall biosynthesis